MYALFSQKLGTVGKVSVVTFTIQHLVTVKNSLIVVVVAMGIGLKQLLSVLQLVLETVSYLKKNIAMQLLY